MIHNILYLIVIFTILFEFHYSFPIRTNTKSIVFNKSKSLFCSSVRRNGRLYSSATDKKQTSNDSSISPLVKKLTNVISLKEIQYHLDQSHLVGMEALLTTTKSRKLTKNDLITEWNKISDISLAAISSSKTSKKSKAASASSSSTISLRKLLPLLYSNDEVLTIVNDSFDSDTDTDIEKDKRKEEEEEIYITENELLRIWQSSSFQALGKSMDTEVIKSVIR